MGQMLKRPVRATANSFVPASAKSVCLNYVVAKQVRGQWAHLFRRTQLLAVFLAGLLLHLLRPCDKGTKRHQNCGRTSPQARNRRALVYLKLHPCPHDSSIKYSANGGKYQNAVNGLRMRGVGADVCRHPAGRQSSNTKPGSF